MLTIKQARENLRRYSDSQKQTVQVGYERYLHEISESVLEERCSISHLIRYDWLCYCLDNEVFNNEKEFSEVWDSIEVLDLTGVAVS